MMKRLWTVACAAVVGIAALGAQQKDQQSASVQLEAAIKKEVVDGDLKAALELYGRLVQSADPAVAAKAQQRMARLAALSGSGSQLVNTRLAFSSRDERVFGPISRDGRYVASTLYSGRLYLQDLVTGWEEEITKASGPDESLYSPLISPDGKKIAYVLSTSRNVKRLMLTDARGSNTRELATANSDEELRPCDWAQDGKEILIWKLAKPAGGLSPGALARAGRYQFITAATGAVRTLESGAGPCGRLSPDGRYFTAVAADPAGIVVLSADGKDREYLDQAGQSEDPAWSQDGTRVLFSRVRGEAPWYRSGHDLWGIRVVQGKKAGEPELIKKGVGRLLGVSKAGEYYYATHTMTADLYAVDLDASTSMPMSRPRQLTTQFNNWGASFSPNGQSLAFISDRGDRGSVRTLVIRSATGGQERVVTLTGFPDGWIGMPRDRPLWFSNDTLLVRFAQTPALYLVDTRSGAAKLLTTLQQPPFNVTPYHGRLQLSADAKSVFYVSGSARATKSIVRQNLDGGPSQIVYQSQGTFLSGPALSPDGTMLAFAASSGSFPDDNVSMVMVMPIAGGQPREVCRVDDHVQNPIWSRDGQRLIFTTYNNPPRKGVRADVWTVPVAGGQPKAMNLGLHWVFFPALSPDGRQLVIRDENFTNDVWVIRNLFSK